LGGFTLIVVKTQKANLSIKGCAVNESKQYQLFELDMAQQEVIILNGWYCSTQTTVSLVFSYSPTKFSFSK
jgi:hypothetical protein